jgi:CheY-like chemotaxis protein
VFFVELAVAVAPQLAVVNTDSAEPAQVQFKTEPCTVLYVEDNQANLQLVEKIIMRRPEIRLLSAKSGPLGIELARAEQPNVVLMDINLPGMNGIKAMQILHADAATAHIPVIAISANAIPRDVELGLEAGFFRYLTKPIRVNEFMDALDRALEYSRTAPIDTNETGVPL